MLAPVTILLDNGSLQPAATRRLRGLARELALRLDVPVAPVSLLHSSAVLVDQLDGTPAEIFEPAMLRRLSAGHADFTVVPLFFGPSGALTEYVPARIAHLRQDNPALRVRMAPPLFQPDDDRLAQILADLVRTVYPAPGSGDGNSFGAIPVTLVDHGSPVRALAAVRDELAAQLGAKLGGGFRVSPSSMERRAGAEYDFCNPLLADLLRQPGWNCGPVIVALQFLLPGRHAGPSGDVAMICREAGEVSGGMLETRTTGLVGDHPALLDILVDRWKQASPVE